jgi:putative ABC transport system permease protein
MLLVTVQLDPQQFQAERGLQFYQTLLDRTRALPGVEAASLTKNVPINRLRTKLPPVAAEGREPVREHDWLNADPDYISPEYFKTLGITLQQGREFDRRDTANAEQTVIINRTLANKLWPGQEAIGRRLKFLGQEKAATVIGIAPDMKYRSLTEPPVPYFYLAAAQHYMGEMTLQIFTTGEPLSLVGAVRETIRATDQDAFIGDISTINSQIQVALSQPMMTATFAGLLGVIALLLATLGLYSVMSFVVAQRTRELGIRQALGAEPRDLIKLIIRFGARLAFLGIAIGLIAAFLATRLLTTLLYGVNTNDLLTFVGTALFLLSVALLACWIPARRATKVDPLVALRHE